jgi:glycosyltransferase involved in cell wall biosynthesis
MANLMTFTLTAFFKALAVLRRGDRVLVVTNPPTVPFVIAAASYLRGASCFLLIHDVYPDAMVAAGMIREGSPLTRLLHAFQCWLYRSVTHVIVLGRDMRALIEKRSANRSDAISIVPNWADTEQLAPAGRAGNPLLRRLGLDSALVVQYSGNMGRTHGIECIVRAAAALPPASRAHLLFIGSGAKRSWLEREVAARQLGNCTVLSPLRRDELATSLNACDVAIIAFVPGMAGVSVPSRMYNIMAVGKPIIAVAEEESELALVVREEQIGWVVRPDDVDGLREAIVQAERDPDGRAAMGERARRAAEEKYAYDVVIQKYTRLFNESQG